MEEMIKRMPSGNGMQELLKLEKETVDEIQVPTLLIYSKGDKVCDWHQGEVIFDCIQAPKKEFCVLEHSGHVLTADGERDLVFQRIETFIEKHCNV